MTKNTNEASSAPIALLSANYVRIAEYEGQEVRLYARPVDASLFSMCQLYTVEATRGENKGSLEYFVTVEDYKANKPARVGRVSQKEAIAALKASGLSDSDIIAKLLG